jgi:two-component system C4-dicarboxylate transport sensor histidine kinase DctB
MIGYRAALYSSAEQAEARLKLQVNGFVSSLDKYRLLTPLLARRPDIHAVLSSSGDDEDFEAALNGLGRIAVMSDAAEIELTFPDGGSSRIIDSKLVPQTQNSDEMLSRPDIAEAYKGSLGRFFQVTGESRHYVFSSPVRIEGNVAGIVSVHVDLADTEQNWALSANPILATVRDRVVLANREGWHGSFLARGAQSGDAKSIDVKGIDNNAASMEAKPSLFGPMLVRVSMSSATGDQQLRDYVAVSHYDPLLGWRFFALEPLRAVVLDTIVVLLVGALFAGLVFGGLWVVFSRQSQQLSQRRRDLASSLRLERKVRDRTRELRQMQAGLIHSAKLAAIGQMSAVLSHEYNQPLAAIRSYSDNARLLFDGGHMEQGQDNLERIGKLVDRLASLSKTLKTFARRPGIDTKPISIKAVVDESVMLMLPQARKQGVMLEAQIADTDLVVVAGHTRLEQVLINLIANALDAIAEAEADAREAADATGYGANIGAAQEKRVRLDAFVDQDHGVIRVSDSGAGVDKALRAEIFEPFVTSKDKGIGLGLGLPIAFNLVKGFGGTLSLADMDEKPFKTCFEIRLPLAREP